MDSLVTSSILDPSNILSLLYPTQESCKKRDAVFTFLQTLIANIETSAGTFAFGSRPLKVYLPGGDIDIGIILPAWKSIRFFEVLSNRLAFLASSGSDMNGMRVTSVNYVSSAEVKLVKCIVDGIPVDITANTLTGLCAVVFFEHMSVLVGRDQLFKKSVLLIKAWMANESRILASHQFLLSSYAVETMVLFTLNFFHADLSYTVRPNTEVPPFPNVQPTPLTMLWRFLHIFAHFDMTRYCVTIAGPVSLASLADLRHLDINVPSSASIYLPPDAVTNNPSIRSLNWVAFPYPPRAMETMFTQAQLQHAVYTCCSTLSAAHADANKLSGPNAQVDDVAFPALIGAKPVSVPSWPVRSKSISPTSPTHTLPPPPAVDATSTATPATSVPSLILPSPPSKALIGTSFLVVDPLDATNNIGRSVSVANQSRIVQSLLKGYKEFTQVIEAAKEVHDREMDQHSTQAPGYVDVESLGLDLTLLIPSAMAARDVAVKDAYGPPSQHQRDVANIRMRLYGLFFHSLRKYLQPNTTVNLTPYLPYAHARALQSSLLPPAPTSPMSPSLEYHSWNNIPSISLEPESHEFIHIPHHSLHTTALNRLLKIQSLILDGADIEIPLLTEDDLDLRLDQDYEIKDQQADQDQWWYTDGPALHSQLSMLKLLMAESYKTRPTDRIKNDRNPQQQTNNNQQKKKKNVKKNTAAANAKK